MAFPIPSFADLLDALWLLGVRIAAAVKGEPAPPIADTAPPDGMTANEQAARERAEADAAGAAAGTSNPSTGPTRTP